MTKPINKYELLNVLDGMMKHLSFDAKLGKELMRFRLSWLNRNPEHSRFIGSNLLGVDIIKFSPLDINLLFSDVLNLDYIDTKESIHNVDEIEPEYKVVSSDPFNIVILYLIRQYLLTPKVSRSDGKQITMTLYKLFAYKIVSSLLVPRFKKYQPSPQVAMLVYEKLSNHFILKKEGTWEKMFEYRAKDILDTNGLHHKRLLRFETQDSIRIINDLQSRLRDTMNYLFKVLVEVNASGEKIQILSGTVSDIDGGDVIRELTNRPDIYIDYMLSIIHDKNTFIKNDLLRVIQNIFPTIEIQHLRTALGWCSDNIGFEHDVLIKKTMTDVILLTLSYLNSKKFNISNLSNIEEMLMSIKGMWVSSRRNDGVLEKLKKDGDTIVKVSTNKRTTWTVVSTRIAMFLYFYLRAMAKNAYT